MTKHHILCIDEGHGPVSPMPNAEEGSTALMVNPNASPSVLLDAAAVRVTRIVDVAKPFLEFENTDFDFPKQDAVNLLTALCGMGQEVAQLLKAIQYHPRGQDPMLLSYRQTVEAAEALLDAMARNPVTLTEMEGAAVSELEGHLGAARDDFLGKKEAQS